MPFHPQILEKLSRGAGLVATGFPLIVGGIESADFDILSLPNKLKAGPESYGVVLDHCQDTKLSQANGGDGDEIKKDLFQINAKSVKSFVPDSQIKDKVKAKATEKRNGAGTHLMQNYWLSRLE